MKIAQAFISCRLDYCISLLYSISCSLLQRLQSVQNAAARLVTGTRRSDYITPVLRQLHWLPDRQRFNFMIAGCVFHAGTDRPSTRAYRVLSYSERRKLRLSDIRICVTPERLRDSVTEVFQLQLLHGPQVCTGLRPALRLRT